MLIERDGNGNMTRACTMNRASVYAEGVTSCQAGMPTVVYTPVSAGSNLVASVTAPDNRMTSYGYTSVTVDGLAFSVLS